jgi:hypothetical protein
MQIARTLKHSIGGIILITLATTGSAQAANLVQNGNFDLGTIPSDANGNLLFTVGNPFSSIPFWQTIGSTPDTNVALIDNTFGYGLSSDSGSNFVDLTGTKETGPWGGIQQIIPTVANTEYVLSFALGYNSDYPGPIGITVDVGAESQGFTYNTPAKGNIWKKFGFSFTAQSSATPISFKATQGGSGFFKYVGLDSVSVFEAPPFPPTGGPVFAPGPVSDPPVATPEPSAILGLTILSMGTLIQRRLAKAKKIDAEKS